jgi:hypothetical protein
MRDSEAGRFQPDFASQLVPQTKSPKGSFGDFFKASSPPQGSNIDISKRPEECNLSLSLANTTGAPVRQNIHALERESLVLQKCA